MSGPNEFQELLPKSFPRWSETDRPVQIGLKSFVVMGDVLREVFRGDQATLLIEKMKEQLPADVSFMDLDDQVMRLVWLPYSGARDAYCVIFASQEWEIIPPGEEIPRFEPVLNAADFRGGSDGRADH